jgi:hypothetical protein
MVKITATIDSADFQNALSKFPNLCIKEMQLALLSSSKSIVNQAHTVHRFKSKGGQLVRSIQNRLNPENKLEAEVFFNEGVATYGKYQHDGTGKYGPRGSEYPITPKSRKSLYFVSGGNKVFRKSVMHPGIKPDRFIIDASKVKEPQFRQNVNNAVNLSIIGAGLKVS